jgi:signal transduction histidine kinase
MVEQIKLFFAVNNVIVQFVHGQVFFVLGVTMALQWRQRSRLELARALPWLAGFGLLEAVATWGNSFIPLQTTLLSPLAIDDLRFAQLLVYLATFLALLGFGLKLNEPAVPARLTLYAPAGLLIGVGALLVAMQLLLPADTTRNVIVEVALRYTLCTPAALLVAYGLRQQAARLVGPFHVERILSVLRIAGFCFLFYALVEGIFVPMAPFFPASVLNSQRVTDIIDLPIGVLRAAVGALIAFYFVRVLEIFRIEADRVAQALEREQSLREERERISRDLHDGTIQQIYAAGLMLDGARHSLDQVTTGHSLPAREGEVLGKALVQMDQVMTALNKTIQGIRSYIYDLRTSAADEDLARGLIQIVSEFRNRTGMPTNWNAEGRPAFALSAEQRQQVYGIAREALNNVARHSGATHVSVDLRYDGSDNTARAIRLRISDDGTGVIPAQGQLGRGLRNMRERAQLLGASFDIQGLAGKGTVVTLELKDVEDPITAG